MSSCRDKTFVEGDFVYVEQKKTNAIIELSEEGKKNKYLVIHKYVRNKPVGVGQNVWFNTFHYMESYVKLISNSWVLHASLSYMYNYDNAENEGFYWIDDYDNEKVEYVPKEPEREGYSFKGWYKDIEGTVKWNFEEDIIPKKEYDDE